MIDGELGERRAGFLERTAFHEIQEGVGVEDPDAGGLRSGTR